MKEKLLALRRFAKPSALSAGALALSTRAMAEIPAEVTTNTSAIKTDGVTIATAILVAIVAVFAIKFLRRGL